MSLSCEIAVACRFTFSIFRCIFSFFRAFASAIFLGGLALISRCLARIWSTISLVTGIWGLLWRSSSCWNQEGTSVSSKVYLLYPFSMTSLHFILPVFTRVPSASSSALSLSSMSLSSLSLSLSLYFIIGTVSKPSEESESESLSAPASAISSSESDFASLWSKSIAERLSRLFSSFALSPSLSSLESNPPPESAREGETPANISWSNHCCALCDEDTGAPELSRTIRGFSSAPCSSPSLITSSSSPSSLSELYAAAAGVSFASCSFFHCANASNMSTSRFFSFFPIFSRGCLRFARSRYCEYWSSSMRSMSATRSESEARNSSAESFSESSSL
mmetsp:Transcript_8139/g.34218  ORF Transcript_8139/g.34218 Transcript_8139/m.34218 type:complete len:334 (-) Transcript_8139:1360-2361(-)